MATPKILAPFTRITSGRALIPEIDGLRFFAIITVVLYHLNTQLLRASSTIDAGQSSDSLWGMVVSRLGLGVQVFFAISGFVLALPFARHHLQGSARVSLKPYFWRRLTRLEPPYILALLLLFAGGVAMGEYSLMEGLPHLGASILYIHNIVYDAWSTINPVAWSLEVEVQFYILAPVLSLVFAIRHVTTRRLAMALVILASILWSYYAKGWIEDIHMRKSLLNNLHYFLTGFLLADVYLNEWQRKARLEWLNDVLGLIALPLLWYGTKLYPANAVAFIVGICLLFLAAFRGKLFRTFFQNPWVVTIGGMCYTIYLLHYALFALVMKFTTQVGIGTAYLPNYLLQCLLVLPMLLIASALYFRYFERPFMRKDWPQRVMQRIRRKKS